MIKDEIQKVRGALVAADNAILSVHGYNEALGILDRALAAPEQEPVVYWDGDRSVIPADEVSYIPNWTDYYPTPLYRHPAPQSAQPMQWIDVSERVPDEAQIVLFVLKGKVVVGAWIAGIFWYDNAKQVATAWMPLPPPPEFGVGGYPVTAPVAAPQRETNVVEALRRCLDELKGHNDSPYCDFRDSFNDIMEQAESALGAKNVDRAPHARDAVAWTPETGYVFADAKNANAAPDSSLAPIIESLIGKYWDIAYEEGKTGISQGDLANQVLGRIRNALIAWAQRAAPQDQDAKDAALYRYLKTVGWTFVEGLETRDWDETIVEAMQEVKP